MKISIITPALLIFLSSCFLIKIEQLENRTNDDGSGSVTKSDSACIRKFNADNYESVKRVDSSSQIILELVDVKNIQEIISKNEKTLITFWASWCPVCHKQLVGYHKIVDSLKKVGIHSLFVAQNLNIAYSQQILFKDSFFFQTYILHDNQIGSDESQKQYRLLKQFDQNIKNNDGSIPASFLMNNKGTILTQKAGIFKAADFMKN